VDKTYAGPKLEELEGNKYAVTLEFIDAMIQWFKDGKTLPRRYVWEIVLGAHAYFEKEESLVDVHLPDDVTCDVIGDVHGASETSFRWTYTHGLQRPILRHATPVLHDRETERHALPINEWGSSGSRVLVYRSNSNSFRV
jgi:hypothetical protein